MEDAHLRLTVMSASRDFSVIPLFSFLRLPLMPWAAPPIICFGWSSSLEESLSESDELNEGAGFFELFHDSLDKSAMRSFSLITDPKPADSMSSLQAGPSRPFNLSKPLLLYCWDGGIIIQSSSLSTI